MNTIWIQILKVLFIYELCNPIHIFTCVFIYLKQTTELEKATAKIVFAFVTYQKKEVILANVQ